MGYFCTALGILTRIPVKFDKNIDGDKFQYCVVFFFIVGIIVGAVIAAVKYVVDFLNIAYLGALTCVTAECLITGALHTDGFADVCDAFFAAKGSEDRLKIMKDSRLGTYGVIGIFILLFLKVILINAVTVNIFKLTAIPVVGKIPLIICMSLGKYPRDDGMGLSFVGKLGKGITTFSLIECAVVVILFLNMITGIIAVVTTALIGLAILQVSNAKIGGITGDVLGCADEIGETAGLMILVLA